MIKKICDVCDAPIPQRSGQNTNGYVRTCCQEHSKLLDRYHQDVERARAHYQEELKLRNIISQFLYGV